MTTKSDPTADEQLAALGLSFDELILRAENRRLERLNRSARSDWDTAQIALKERDEEIERLREAVNAAEAMWAYAIDYASPGTKLQRECNAFREAADALGRDNCH